MMKIKHVILGGVSVLLLAACGGHNSNSAIDDGTRNFNDFVINLVQNQSSETAEPIEINNLIFEFEAGAMPGDNEDEMAFDALL